MEAPVLTRRFYPIGELRSYRLSRGITLIRVAVATGISLARASEVERFPERARPGEIDRLKRAVDELARERDHELTAVNR